MKISHEEIRYGGQRIQTPRVQVATPDPNVILESTFHNSPVHIREQPEGNYSIKVIEVNWSRIPLNNPAYDIEGQHGEIRGAATMKSREVVIRGEIFAPSRQGLENARDAVMAIYSPPIRPSLTNRGFKKFSYVDTQGKGWFFYAQVLQRTANFISEIWQHHIVPFEVRLVTDGDPRIFSEEVFTENLTAGFVAGMDVGESAQPLGVQNLGAQQGGSDIVFDGQWFSPTVITIEVEPTSSLNEIKNPKILNEKTGDIFGVDYTLSKGDILEVDGFNKTIKVNGTLKQNIRSSDAFFINLVNGTNRIVAFSDDHPYIYGDSIKATLQYRNIKI